jgi:hypothetical protein
MKKVSLQCAQRSLIVGSMAVFLLFTAMPAHSQTENYEFNDSHCHLTNNVQKGPSVRDFLNMMGNRVGRATLFGVPLQQEWALMVGSTARLDCNPAIEDFGRCRFGSAQEDSRDKARNWTVTLKGKIRSARKCT